MSGTYAIGPGARADIRRRALTAIGILAVRLGGRISGWGARTIMRAETDFARAARAIEDRNNADDWIELGRVFPEGWQVLAHASWTARRGGAETDCPYPAGDGKFARQRERWIEMFRFVAGELAGERAAG